MENPDQFTASSKSPALESQRAFGVVMKQIIQARKQRRAKRTQERVERNQEQEKWTQKHLAEEIDPDWDSGELRRLLRGEKPLTPSLVEAVCDALKTTIFERALLYELAGYHGIILAVWKLLGGKGPVLPVGDCPDLGSPDDELSDKIEFIKEIVEAQGDELIQKLFQKFLAHQRKQRQQDIHNQPVGEPAKAPRNPGTA